MRESKALLLSESRSVPTEKSKTYNESAPMRFSRRMLNQFSDSGSSRNQPWNTR